jgi:HPt (histidine-containing phosphotransfer) domain-containing protein
MKEEEQPMTVLDYQQLSALAMGDQEFMGELAQDYRYDLQEQMELLLETMEGDELDMREIRKIAHTIKGLAANVGGQELASLARKIENESRGISAGKSLRAQAIPLKNETTLLLEALDSIHELARETRRSIQ